jgi:hypothetical protein
MNNPVFAGKNQHFRKPRQIKRGLAMEIQNKEVSDADRRRVGGAKQPTKIAVTVRQQTPEEERRTAAAVQLLLTELVRQQLGCEGTE